MTRKKIRKRNARLQMLINKAMEEVHTNIPSTVSRANVSGARREAMLRRIAFEKVRQAGHRVPKRHGR